MFLDSFSLQEKNNRADSGKVNDNGGWALVGVRGFHSREQKGPVRAIVEGDLFLPVCSSFFFSFFLSSSLTQNRALKIKIVVGKKREEMKTNEKRQKEKRKKNSIEKLGKNMEKLEKRSKKENTILFL